MATTIASATLTLTVVEDLTLDGIQLGKSTSRAITSITQWVKRIVTVPITTNGLTLFTLSSADSSGQYIGTEVRYLRITNKDDSNYVTVFLKNAASNDCAGFKVTAGTSLILFNDAFDADQTDIDNVAFDDLSIVEALANTAACDVEYVVALAS